GREGIMNTAFRILRTGLYSKGPRDFVYSLVVGMGGALFLLPMNRPFVLVLVLDRVAWLRGGGRERGRSGSWSQCMRKNERGLPMNPSIPFGIPLRMKKYSARRVALGARNLFRSGGGRTEVRAPVASLNRRLVASTE